MNTIVILGAGAIGQAVAHFLKDDIFNECQKYIWDANSQNLNSELASTLNTHVIDFNALSAEEISTELCNINATHIINALPFYLNYKVAKAAVNAKCNYIDFTEDDIMADKVQALYANSNLTCAVKCGLAPGFINYIGHDLASQIHQPESLVISVGALPKNVNLGKRVGVVGKIQDTRYLSYNLTWSIDGLVNEYLNPCRVRENGQEKLVDALSTSDSLIIDGTEYEVALTSGGVGSLTKELAHIPNVCYKTIRYPGHYDFVRDTIWELGRDFNLIKKRFLDLFPYTKNDVIVVYGEVVGKDNDGKYRRETYAEHFVGTGPLTAIQSTTAGSGVAVLELMLAGKISGLVNHKDISISTFINTHTATKSYIKR